MPKILKAFTLCSVTIQIDQALTIRMREPTKSQQERIREDLNFQEVKVDEDGDVLMSEGSVAGDPLATIRSLLVVRSKDFISAEVLGGETQACLDAIHAVASMLYGISQEELTAGITFVDYKTITKVQLGGSLDGIFAPPVREMLARWRDFHSEEVVDRLEGELDADSGGMVTTSETSFERMYAGLDELFVIPSDLSFQFFVPTRFYKMTQYKVRLQTSTLEDYLENIYFLQTSLSYRAHERLLEEIERIITTA